MSACRNQRQLFLPNGRNGKSYAIVAWAIVLVACIGIIVYVATKPGPQPPDLPEPPPVGSDNESVHGPATTVQLAAFYDREVVPAIDEADQANREAAKRCIQRLREMFDRQRKGIPPFTEDLTSLGTRFGILRRMPSDWWNERDDVQDYVTRKFEKHIFSEDSLKQDVEGALATFRDAVEANNNALLTKVRAAVSRSDLPNLPDIEYGDYLSELSSRIAGFAATSAGDNVTNAIITLIASEVGAQAATRIIVAVGTRIAAVAATSSATAGGVTASGAVAGGGGGSLGGPAGTAVGFGAGLVVGVIIDWWMTARFKEELSKQLHAMIDDVESSLILGADGQPGLEAGLDQACTVLRDANSDSLYKRIVKEPAL